ncbi:MAG: helicase-related protein, partial [Eubacteriales bacterium]|nr:helicase-related protein [Eubacteriales bacterium]
EPDKLYQSLKRVNVIDKTKAGGWPYHEAAEFTVRQDESSILVVVNTKSCAKHLYDLLSQNGDFDTVYLSTNMCAAHRKSVINSLKERLVDPGRARRLVCVSTQLIEAGVDIDFNCVIRSVCGLDSIAQAAGRCNRNGKMENSGPVYIINLSDENLNHLPEIKTGQIITKDILYEYKTDPKSFDDALIGIKAIQRYFAYLYDKYASENKDVFEYLCPQYDTTLYELLSSNANITRNSLRRGHITKDTNLTLRQSFKLASGVFKSIDTQSRGILTPYREGAQIIAELASCTDPGKISKLLKKAQPYTINIYPYQFNRLYDEHKIFEAQEGLDIYYLADPYYDDTIGLCDGENKTLNV